MKLIDITGQRFGFLTAIELTGRRAYREAVWVCECDCGNTTEVPGSRLRQGHTKSCGCYKRRRIGDLARKHGKSKSVEYSMFYDAKKRATARGLPFLIEPRHIKIPTQCPILGVPLMAEGERESRPSLDRIVPAHGYVPSNIRVISFRANRIKSDATADELRLILQYMEEACTT